MAKLKANDQRYDQYKNFRFLIKCDGRYVAGVSKVVSTGTTPDPGGRSGSVDQAGRFPFPGQPATDAVTLERGLTYDLNFHQWAAGMANDHAKPAAGTSSNDFRKDIKVEVYDEPGRLVSGYIAHRCRVVEYQFMPELDGSGNAVIIQQMTLESEGWERDTSIADPGEPDYKFPAS